MLITWLPNWWNSWSKPSKLKSAPAHPEDASPVSARRAIGMTSSPGRSGSAMGLPSQVSADGAESNADIHAGASTLLDVWSRLAIAKSPLSAMNRKRT